MQKFNLTIFFGLTLLLLLGSGQTTLAQKRSKRDKLPINGFISLRTLPEAYPVFINGKDYGMSGSPEPNQIELAPGTYDVEVRFPNKSYTKSVTIDAGKRNCMCLTYNKKIVSRPCPYDVTVDAPTAVNDGDNIVFTANPSYTGPPTNLLYKWTLAPETVQIRDGQGTPSITIDSTNLGDQRVTATLEVDSGDSDITCRQRIPVSVYVKALPKVKPTAVEVDRFDFTNNDALKARLDNFAVALQNQPDAGGYIVVYGKTGSKPTDADKLGMKALDYLTRSRGIDARRVIVSNWGFHPSAGFEFYLIPPGADPPMPNR